MKCIWEPHQDKYKCINCGAITHISTLKRNCTFKPSKQRKDYPNPKNRPKPKKAPVKSTHNKPIPPLLKRLSNFAWSAAKHAFNGNPTCTEEQIEERLKICRECEWFKRRMVGTSGICTHESCGCNIKDFKTYLNKLAWADQECPVGKWGKIDNG